MRACMSISLKHALNYNTWLYIIQSKFYEGLHERISCGSVYMNLSTFAKSNPIEPEIGLHDEILIYG